MLKERGQNNKNLLSSFQQSQGAAKKVRYAAMRTGRSYHQAFQPCVVRTS